MKALVYENYGSPELLDIREVDKPIPKAKEVLIKVHAASINSSDYEMLTGNPAYVRIWGLFKPKFKILGSDIAGVVEAVGSEITQFEAGDEVFGDNFNKWGGFAEFVCAPEKVLVAKPKNLSFIEAAALPQAGVVALQGLTKKVDLHEGQKVLINGAGGGSGSFALQLAKNLGAEVSGVDSAGKLDFMKSMGADHVSDYSLEDFTKNGNTYDLILDLVATHPILDYKRALKPGGRYYMVGGSVPQLLKALFIGGLITLFGKKKIGVLGVTPNTKDLNYLMQLIQTDKVKVPIDKTFTLLETEDALSYFGEGKALGKVVISVRD